MSDSAFKTAAFPAYTTAELREHLKGKTPHRKAMEVEIERRERVANGDVSVMTPGERLRFSSTGKAR